MSKAKAENRELPKRFYTQAGVINEDGQWFIVLDGRAVKTPAKKTLALPSEALAMAVAVEWEDQEEVINPFEMPLTRLCNVAIDRMGAARTEAAEEVARFAETDLLCYRSDVPTLAEEQAKVWDPCLNWAARALDAPLNITDGLAAISQPDVSLNAIRQHALALDDLRLTALVSAVPILTSAVLGFQLLHDEASAEDLWCLSLLEVDFQERKWGQDEEARQAQENKKRDLLACEQLMRLLDQVETH
jgi:chaperone required for assembly of F1-ATPase